MQAINETMNPPYDEAINFSQNREYQRLNYTFNNSMNLEGRSITIGDETHKCFFRRKDEYTVMYAPTAENISLGALFRYCDEPYLILKSITDTNLIYQRYLCKKCNDSFKMQFADCVAEFECFNNTLSDSLNTNKDGNTTTSKTEFILTLDDTAKKIRVNQRFLCGYAGLAWKIIDINYLNNLCYLHVERSPVSEHDDIENMIADAIDIDTPVEVAGEIEVDPPCDNPYELIAGWGEETFTCSIDGVANPVWVITAPSNDNMTFSTSGNTFTCECLYGSNECINVAIVEQSSNQTVNYEIKLTNFM